MTAGGTNGTSMLPASPTRGGAHRGIYQGILLQGSQLRKGQPHTTDENVAQKAGRRSRSLRAGRATFHGGGRTNSRTLLIRPRRRATCTGSG